MSQPSAEWMAEVRACASEYTALGWRVLPVVYREKRPAGEWKRWKVAAPPMSPAELVALFDGTRPHNLGVVLGTVSGGLVDVDLDCPEALALAPLYLPPTLTFGRASKPRSHWLYTSPGSTYAKYNAARASEDASVETLLELRADMESVPGESAGQTVFPPSIHVSGEPVEWSADCAGMQGPAQIDAADLRKRTRHLAAACVVQRYAGEEVTRAWLQGAPMPRLCPPSCRHADTPTRDEGACPTRLVRALLGLVNVQPKPAPRRVLHGSALEASGAFDAAVEAYNRAHAREYPRDNGPCPVCGSPDGFSMSRVNGAWIADRWACKSTRHASFPGRGRPSADGVAFTGDALDIDAHEAGCERHALLRRLNFLKPR